MLHSLFVPYGQGLGRSIRELEQIAAKCPHDFSLKSRETVSATLSRLKRKGMVGLKRKPRQKLLWQITAAGKRHFKTMRKEKIPLDLPPKDGKVRLIIFDIPENERQKRDWLRLRLLSCDYTSLQKSVWVGERPLPREMLKELKTRGIAPYIHVVGLEEALRTKTI